MTSHCSSADKDESLRGFSLQNGSDPADCKGDEKQGKEVNQMRCPDVQQPPF